MLFVLHTDSYISELFCSTDSTCTELFRFRNQTAVPEGREKQRCKRLCVVSICVFVCVPAAGIHPVSRRQRIVAVDHGVHRRAIHRHLPSDARADHVHSQPRQAHHHRPLAVRRALLRTLARSRQHQVYSASCNTILPAPALALTL